MCHALDERLTCRYDEDAALTFGKAVSGMFAHAKGKSIGVIEGKEKNAEVRPFVVSLPAPDGRADWQSAAQCYHFALPVLMRDHRHSLRTC